MRRRNYLTAGTFAMALLLAGCQGEQSIEAGSELPVKGKTGGSAEVDTTELTAKADAAKADAEAKAAAAKAEAEKATAEAEAAAKAQADAAAEAAKAQADAAVEAAEAAVASVVALADEAPLVSINGETITVGTFKTMAKFRPVPDSPLNPDTDVPTLRGKSLEDAARRIAAYAGIAAEAKANGFTIPEEIVPELKSMMDRYSGSTLYKEVIVDKQTKPTQEELLKKYEETKETNFSQLEELRMRQIFISTYEPYTVKAGDTLESIAKEIAGDVTLADKILSDETKRPRVETTEAPAEVAEGQEAPKDPLPPKALTEGELLMVPGNTATATRAAERIAAAHAALKGGESFVNVAKEYSENARPGELWIVRPAQQERQIMAEITEAFHSLADDQFSDPIKTRHGYHIILRELYTEAGFTPFDIVANTVEQNLLNEQRRQLEADFFNSIVTNPEMVSVNNENVVKDPAEDADVLVTINGKEYTRAELRELTRNQVDQPEFKTPEGFIDFLKQGRGLQNPMLDAYKQVSGFNDRPDTKLVQNIIDENALAESYVEHLEAQNVVEISDEEVSKFYEENKERFKQPETYNLNVASILVEIGDQDALAAAKASLTEQLADIYSIEDFRQLADRVQDQTKQPVPGGALGNRIASTLDLEDLMEIRKVEAPGKTEVFTRGNQALAYWVSEAKKEGYMPMEQQAGQIREQLKTMRSAEFREAKFKEFAEKAAIELLATE